MHKRLFIPGPVDVRQEVLEKMSKPMIGHRTKDATKLQQSISDKIRKLMYTENMILISTSSGSGLMEGAVRSCTAKRAAVFSIGAFGDRWYKMCTANNVPADKFSAQLGQATDPAQVDEVLATGKYDVITITHNETATGVANPLDELSAVIRKYPDVIWLVDAVSSLGGDKIEVDRLGIDICITSTQKCIGLPPGMSFCSFSQKALEHAKTVEHRGLYFDFVELARFVEEKPYQYPSTPSLSHMFALDAQLDYILEEGLDNRFDRHRNMADRVREWATENYALYSDPAHLSQTVTCITNTKNFSVSKLNQLLGERGYSISNGYGALKDKTFRIAHMADTTMDELEALLNTIDTVVKEMQA
ncbi:MAG: pyridoxal-phosphate-dependent aminotransferase family protein [Fastidiosipilaceae bacterium]|jgi:predicted phosphoserine aminotransferase